MCTLSFCSYEFADCFMEGKEPNACGCSYSQCSGSNCTRHKYFAVDDLEVKVQIPSVDDMKCRTACCCYYCGCAFGPCLECMACRNAGVTCGCCDNRSACSCIGSGGDRACCKGISMGKQCSCDKPDEPATGYEAFTNSTCLCCLKCERMGRCTCTPIKYTCCQTKSQNCCVYGKCGFPCTEEVPCEVGLFGIMCINKAEAIKVYEIKNPDEVGFNRVECEGAPVAPETELVAVATPIESEQMDKRQ